MSLGTVEGSLRLAPARGDSITARLRQPRLYADPFNDDDYWKLQNRFGGPFGPPNDPHPLLGWVGNFDRESFRYGDAGALAGRRPVLLYGDSFARA